MKPKHPAFFKRCKRRLLEKDTLARIDGILVFQCGATLMAWHGSYARAGLSLIWYGLKTSAADRYWRCVYWFCDSVGWTHLRRMNYGPVEFYERHGSHCTYMNCQDMQCVDKGIPKWFQKLTGMERF